MDSANQIALNFIRPDVGRPGNHDFVHHGPWLVSQFQELGVRWNRLAFSWTLVQPAPGVFDWEPYDRIVQACERAGIHILATLGGHFDRPPVPAWAGETLAQVVNQHPEYLERFIRAWVERYHGTIKHWEMLNEPRTFHVGLTIEDYVERILKPGYRIVKATDPAAQVLPCAYDHLPMLGDKELFWDAARGYYDIQNLHIYVQWGYFRDDRTAEKEEARARAFRELMVRHGEGDKLFWITEIGWWGTGGINTWYDFYKKDPGTRTLEFKPYYTGHEILTHPVTLREDALRATWMQDMYPRMLAIPGCEKVFLWVAMDEFEGGYDPDRLYGTSTDGTPVGQMAMWAIIAGDQCWRKSAYTLQTLLRQ
jgi:hypothetical protein